MRSALGDQYYRKLQDPKFKQEMLQAESEEAFKRKWLAQKYEGAKDKYNSFISSYQTDFAKKKREAREFLEDDVRGWGWAPAGHLDELHLKCAIAFQSVAFKWASPTLRLTTKARP